MDKMPQKFKSSKYDAIFVVILFLSHEYDWMDKRENIFLKINKETMYSNWRLVTWLITYI